MNNPFYQEVLRKTAQFQLNPEGLSDYIPPGKTDSISVKQNNLIIFALLELNKNLEDQITEINKKLDSLLEKKIPTKKDKQENDIQNLIEQLKRVELTPQEDRPKRKDKTWTFSQTGIEIPKKDKGPVSLKID